MNIKNFKLAVLVAASCGFFGIQSAQASSYSYPGIKGTGHDFAYSKGCYDSATGAMRAGCTPWTTSSGRTEDEICKFCHTPHANPALSSDGAPLWNHQMSTATYVTYASTTNTMNATVGQPTGTSKLCLSCHDGTVAVDGYGSNALVAGHTITRPIGVGGTDLSTVHPVSFTYDAALAAADGGLWDPTTKVSGAGDTPNNWVFGQASSLTVTSTPGSGSTGTIAQDFLDSNSQMQCTSCHEPHRKFGWGRFLRKNNTGSGLCLTCHNK